MTLAEHVTISFMADKLLLAGGRYCQLFADEYERAEDAYLAAATELGGPEWCYHNNDDLTAGAVFYVCARLP